MKVIGRPGLRRFGVAACLVLGLLCGGAGAVEVPLVDGALWVKSSDEVKRAYLVGLANVIQVETAYHADNPLPDARSFSPRVARAMQGQTLDSVLETLDKWYAAHPENLQRPVVETIWFELVLPGLTKTK